MDRKLGILIPEGCLEDDQIWQFCKPYLDDGTFQELVLTKHTSPKKTKPVKVTVHSVTIGKTMLPNELAQKYSINENYIIWVRAFWMMFWRRNPTKVLENADLFEWEKTIRLIVEADKRGLGQMFKYFQYMETLDKNDKNKFWYLTVDSVSGIRKHWDKIEANFYRMEVHKPDNKAGGF